MPVFIQQVVGGLLRTTIAGALGWLVINGWITDQVATEFTAALVSLILVVAWSAWEKYANRKKLMVALTVPEGTTEAKVERIVKAEGAPSVMTSKDAVL